LPDGSGETKGSTAGSPRNLLRYLDMPIYNVTVSLQYEFEIDVDTKEDAIKEAKGQFWDMVDDTEREIEPHILVRKLLLGTTLETNRPIS